MQVPVLRKFMTLIRYLLTWGASYCGLISPESKFPNKYIDVIFIQIDRHLKKLLKKNKGFQIFWNTV